MSLSSSQKAFLWDKMELALEDERLFMQEIENDRPVRSIRDSGTLARFLEDYVSPEVVDDEEE